MKNRYFLHSVLFSLYLFVSVEIVAQTSWRKITRTQQNPIGLVTSLEFENDNSLWVSGSAGLTHITPNAITSYTDAVGQLPTSFINQMKLHKGIVWMATPAGLVKFDKKTFTVYGTADGLLSNNVEHLDIDSKGNVWMVAGGSVSKFDGTQFTNYNDSVINLAIGKGDTIYAIVKDTLTVNGKSDDIIYFDGTSWIKQVDFTPGNSKLSSILFNHSIQSTDENRVYLVTDDASYFEITPNGFSQKVTPQAYNLRNQNITGIAENKKNRFFGTLGGGWPIENSGIIIESNNEYGIICDGLEKGNKGEYYNILDVAATDNKLAVALDDFSILIADAPTSTKNDFEYLDINDIKAGFNSNGDLFSSPHGFFKPELEIPKDEGTHPVFYSGIWLSTVDASNNLKSSANMYSSDYTSGILNTSGSKRTNQILKINKSEIDKHKTDFKNQNYSIPNNIMNWPVNGDSTIGEPLDLAKFIDVNGNGYYDPEKGDYPFIKGDQAVYFIFNDVYATDTFVSNNPIGIEVHALAYAYKSNTKPELNTTFFIDFTIINRSQTDFDTVRFGQFLDFDLGCSSDDYVGCDSAKGAAYVYNGDANDEDCRGVNGYGNNPPVFATCPVNAQTNGFIYFNRSSGPQFAQDPNSPMDVHNYLQSKWRDGSNMFKGGIGHKADTRATGPKTKYMWSGNPLTNTGWTESSSGNAAGDRRGLISIESFNLKVGERKTITMAYGYGRGNTGNYLDNIDEALRVIDVSKQHDLAQNNGNPIVATKRKPNEIIEYGLKNGISVFPNPINSVFYVSTNQNLVSLELIGISGQQFGSFELDKGNISQLNLPNEINSGIYILRWTADNGEVGTERIIVN